MNRFDQTERELRRMEEAEKYIRSLKWSPEATEHEKTLVAGNIRGYHGHVLDKAAQRCIEIAREELHTLECSPAGAEFCCRAIVDEIIGRIRSEVGNAEVRPELVQLPKSTDCANCGHASGFHHESARGCIANKDPQNPHAGRCGCTNFQRQAEPICPGCGEPGHDPAEHEQYPENL